LSPFPETKGTRGLKRDGARAIMVGNRFHTWVRFRESLLYRAAASGDSGINEPSPSAGSLQ